ncbi:MAG: hypothetical protein ABI377_10920 [Devosia sp.]
MAGVAESTSDSVDGITQGTAGRIAGVVDCTADRMTHVTDGTADRIADLANSVAEASNHAAYPAQRTADSADAVADPADHITCDATERPAGIVERLSSIAHQIAGCAHHIANCTKCAVDRAGNAVNRASDGAGRALDRTFSAAKSAVHNVSCGAGDVATSNRTDDGPGDTADDVDCAAERATDCASQAFHRADRVMDGTGSITDGAYHAADVVSDLTTDRGTYRVGDGAERSFTHPGKSLNRARHTGWAACQGAGSGFNHVAHSGADRVRRATDGDANVAADGVAERVDSFGGRAAGRIADRMADFANTCGDVAEASQRVAGVAAERASGGSERIARNTGNSSEFVY